MLNVEWSNSKQNVIYHFNIEDSVKKHIVTPLSLKLGQDSFTQIRWYIDGLVHDCNNSHVLAMELLQSCTKQSI